jgi:hypothetical protein
MSGILGGIAGNLAGGNIGRAVVSLALDTTGYTANLEKAKVETTATTDSMAAGASKWSTAAVAGAAVAGAAIADFAVHSISAAVEAQNEQLKLANAVQNSANVSQDAIPAFQAQAQAIRDLTGVDDDLINGGQSVLVNMGLQQDQITQLTPLVVDLSAKYGIDLNSAFKAVGKAAEGSTGALARYVGPIQAGTTAAGTYTAVLQKLGAVQGFAAEQAKAEPWLLLKSSMQELEQSVGRQLLPLIQELVPLLTQLANDIGPILSAAVKATVDELGPFVDQLSALASLIPQTSANTGQAAQSTGLWGKAFQFLKNANPLTEISKLNEAELRSVGILHDAVPATAQLSQLQVEQSTQLVQLAQHEQLAATETKRHTEAMNQERIALLQLQGGYLGLIGSVQAVAQDEKALAKLRDQGKQGTQAYAAAVVQLLTDNISLKEAVRQEASELRAQGLTAKQVQAQLQQMAQGLGVGTTAFNKATSAAKGLGDQLDRISQTQVTVDVNTSVAERNISRLTSELARLGGP